LINKERHSQVFMMLEDVRIGDKYSVKTRGFIHFLYFVEVANQWVMVYIGQRNNKNKN